MHAILGFADARDLIHATLFALSNGIRRVEFISRRTYGGDFRFYPEFKVGDSLDRGFIRATKIAQGLNNLGEEFDNFSRDGLLLWLKSPVGPDHVYLPVGRLFLRELSEYSKDKWFCRGVGQSARGPREWVA